MLKITRLTRFISKLVAVAAVLTALSACSNIEQITDNQAKKADVTESQVYSDGETGKSDTNEIFSYSDIPEDVRSKMYGVTISDSSLMSFDDLAYLTLTYYGYDEKTHTGNMIVDKKLADEVVSIFRELYEEKFPIEKMILPCEYDGVDELSMRDNNTSSYNDRPIEGNGATSYHQLGRAIDINPLVNPYIRFSDGEVLPKTAREYLDRNQDVKGMIKEDSVCVRIFKKYGWIWGGDWNSVKDYQHFEK